MFTIGPIFVLLVVTQLLAAAAWDHPCFLHTGEDDYEAPATLEVEYFAENGDKAG